MRISDWSSDVCSSDLREVPDLAGFNYLAAADGDNGSTSSFFYQRPGTTTKYVTLGGFVHLSFDDKGNITNTEHGPAVFGDATSYLQLPDQGTGHYDGDFLATMINQESTGNVPVFQWLVEFNSAVEVGSAQVCTPVTKANTVHRHV